MLRSGNCGLWAIVAVWNVAAPVRSRKVVMETLVRALAAMDGMGSLKQRRGGCTQA
jgi:hypothetical protein